MIATLAMVGGAVVAGVVSVCSGAGDGASTAGGTAADWAVVELSGGGKAGAESGRGCCAFVVSGGGGFLDSSERRFFWRFPGKHIRQIVLAQCCSSDTSTGY